MESIFWNGFVKQANLWDQMRKAPGLADKIKAAPSRVNWSGPSRKVGVMPKALAAVSPGKSAPMGAAASAAMKPTPGITQKGIGIPQSKWKAALGT